MKKSLVNAAFFQVVWFACVGGGASGRWWLGPLAVLAFALWHLPRSDQATGDLLLIAVTAPLGLLVDTTFISLGLVSYPTPGPLGPDVAPVWIIALWAGFALTLNHSLAWLKRSTVLAGIIGGVAGPFSYWVGATTWSAVDFVAPSMVVLGAYAVTWAFITPALAGIANRIEKKCDSTVIGPRNFGGVLQLAATTRNESPTLKRSCGQPGRTSSTGDSRHRP